MIMMMVLIVGPSLQLVTRVAGAVALCSEGCMSDTAF